ncbi:hypothetical protein A6R68_09685 [Neotoma lepida]|uniref:Uncharacterized protein n=1 Tax=Neotoma lepida TaxID=56216 RepID=A0A1A6G012_NEOLE|nr:hypothetical protein A6R68_09685 [Neotoma lepida]
MDYARSCSSSMSSLTVSQMMKMQKAGLRPRSFMSK